MKLAPEVLEAARKKKCQTEAGQKKGEAKRARPAVPAEGVPEQSAAPGVSETAAAASMPEPSVIPEVAAMHAPAPAVVPSVPPPSGAEEEEEEMSWSGDAGAEVPGVGGAVGEAAPREPDRRKGKAPLPEESTPPQRVRRVGNREYVDVGISWDDSGLDDADVARKILGVVGLSKDRATLQKLPFRSLLEKSYCTLYRHIHEHAVLTEVARRSSSKVLNLSAQLKAAEAGRKAAEADVQAAADMRAALGRSFEEKEEEYEARISTLQTQLVSAIAEMKRTEDRRQLEATVSRQKLERAVGKNKKLKKSIHSLERARDDAIRRGKDDVLLAELRSVATYKASQEFQDEMAEASLGSYTTGIEAGIERVRRRFPLLDLSDILSDNEEGEGSDGEGAADEPEAAASPEVAVGPSEALDEGRDQPVDVVIVADDPSGAAEAASAGGKETSA